MHRLISNGPFVSVDKGPPDHVIIINMQQTEQTARRICELDLRAKGFDEQELPLLVERFWPVLANEIRQGIISGEWPFDAAHIASLTREYQILLDR